MKICVGCRDREEPASFYLGGTRLPIQLVVERWSDLAHSYYRVQVGDGRSFVLRVETATHDWELVSVRRRAAGGR